MGYQLIDTAQRYENESGIGEAIEVSKKKRTELFITSKQKYHMPVEDAKKAFFKTLENLKTDYLDLFLIHWPSHHKKINQETWRFFEWLYENNYTKAIGVSNFNRSHLEDLFETATIKPHVNQIELHPALNQLPLRTFMHSHDIQTMAYGSLMRGGIFEPPYHTVLHEIGLKYKATVSQVVIAWGLKQDLLMIPKSSNISRLEENYHATKISLTQEDVEVINELNRGKRVYTDPDNNPWGIFKATSE
jgi:diketogulonate reductase-like aldo/keto reductase